MLHNGLYHCILSILQALWKNPFVVLVRKVGVHVNISPCNLYGHIMVNTTSYARMIIYFDNLETQKPFVSIDTNSFHTAFLNIATFIAHINVFYT